MTGRVLGSKDNVHEWKPYGEGTWQTLCLGLAAVDDAIVYREALVTCKECLRRKS